MQPRISVIVPCFDAGSLVLEAVASLAEAEPLEIVVVNDASREAETRAALDELSAAGVRVLAHDVNRGLAKTRTSGLHATSAPYVLPLDADDLAIPAQLTRAADLLDADPGAAVCVGDYEEFGNHEILRTVPGQLDPFRVAFTNEYPVTALFRRSVIERYGGWRDPSPTVRGYEDWNLWMDLAQDEQRIVHVDGTLYRRRMHAPGLDVRQRARHAELYRALRDTHPRLFAQVTEYRRRTDLSPQRKLLYPALYGERRLINRVRFLKPLFDRAGVWTLARRQR